jgi:hypothetical protein
MDTQVPVNAETGHQVGFAFLVTNLALLAAGEEDNL